MEYHEAARFLFELRRFRPKPGTASTADLLAALGDPHEGLDAVQIAGSNGKGSTARMTASILERAGLSVGLYTSPHFDDVRERIRVDGRVIRKAAICEFVSAIHPRVIERAADDDPPTFFEVLTALALWEFDRQDVDVAVLEVGIGGPYDATSAVEPVASAVTSVALEHTDLLGESVEAIARDKARVAPADRPLVTGASGEALAAVRSVAGSTIVVGVPDAGDADGVGEGDGPEEPDVRAIYRGRRNGHRGAVELEGPDWSVETTLPLLGRYQARNAGIAATLARQVADVGADDVAEGLARADWPGRTEVMQREPLVLLDGAHNPAACAELATVLEEFDLASLTLVIGAMHDKDHRAMAAALPSPDRVIACQPANDRAEDEAVLARVYEDAGVPSVTTGRSVADALDRALADADPRDGILVTGSLYTVAEARARWSRRAVPRRVGSLEAGRAALEGADVPAEDAERVVASTVHRVIEIRVSPRQAHLLAEAMGSIGGTCAMSGLAAQDEEPFEIVLAGTVATFDRLLEELRGRGDGVSIVADEIRRRVGEGAAGASTGAGTATGREPDGAHGAIGSNGSARAAGDLPWTDGPCVMGVLNVTPDSFHDGGRYASVDEAVARARAMLEAGAGIVDVGGESTRPGASPVDPATERERVVPVIERIAELEPVARGDALLSVDTRKPAVARAALEAGATMLNDVAGLEDPAMRAIPAEYDVPVVVMHSIDAPVVPEKPVEYDDVVTDVLAALGERVLLAERAGVDRDRILVDPGLGFGKSPTENFALLGRLEAFRTLDCPVMIGHSHKSMFELVGSGPDERLAPTIAASALAVDRGADVVRVHDVAANVAAVRTAIAARHEGKGP